MFLVIGAIVNILKTPGEKALKPRIEWFHPNYHLDAITYPCPNINAVLANI